MIDDLKPVLAALLCCGFWTPASAAQRPDIILIMVDDMGYSDLGCYGGEIATPNIDALARQGVRFSQFYNSARCCPTRASLLTGLHPHQAGIGHMTAESPGGGRDAGPPAYQGHLNLRCVTLAEVAKSAGYATFMAGKWHLAGKDLADWPLQRGFDRYWGLIHGAANHFKPVPPRCMYSGNEPDLHPQSTTERPFYTTDAFTDHAIGFLRDHCQVAAQPPPTPAPVTHPFFLYLAYTAPHWPIQAHDQDIAKYQGRYDTGWDQLREQRYRRQLELGLIDPKWQLSPRDPAVPPWDSLRPDQKADLAMRMSVYAAMIDRIDQNIGKLVTALKQLGRFENTLILFLSDNGACAEGGVFPAGNFLDQPARNASGNISYGMGWANASATPYRLYKHFAHEGGSNTPFFAHWPARIQPRADWCRQPAQIIDIMPTVVELTAATYPRSLRGQEILPGGGVALTPAFAAASLQRNEPLFMEHENNAFIRDGAWKLVGRDVAPATGLAPAKWELYQINADGTELHNLAAGYPDKVAAYSAQWQLWATRSGVYPKPGAGKSKPPRRQ
jgi:arylsulfatase A-like enzyme